ncbi:DUF3164 family protein [Cereibacter sphaeroides]|uniref:DUF3164 family protein n=1 Tax=Cereibacter sphaeroides TaxID=1063 RepID=UPI000F51BE71|nr:DUF3164 family protein [Cereibacter sphaeroides]AZB57242.1 DUF3164 family protein [Cereibacter sphaeroides]AZB61526.1 DUF3164 family protein [Cereibacter sphaeroides]
MTEMTSSFAPADLPAGTVEIEGKAYMRDATGGLRPKELVKPADQLIDETVRRIMGYGVALSDQVARFKGHTFDDVGALTALLDQEYGVQVGGRKGNMTLTSFDGRMRVEIRQQDCFDFGPELQQAKALIDECLTEWAADSRPEIRDIVTRAFNTDRPGQVNRSEIFMLLRLEITDPRWLAAMRAIRDAIRVVGSKTYVRLQMRSSFDGAWESVTIDLARA